MDYETAKRLKDAGFLQEENNGELLPDEVAMAKGIDVESAYAPTLSELIEACGDIILYKLPKDNQWNSTEKDVWIADSIGQYFCADAHFVDTQINGEQGTTPEEAVANLWLALNKK